MTIYDVFLRVGITKCCKSQRKLMSAAVNASQHTSSVL